MSAQKPPGWSVGWCQITLMSFGSLVRNIIHKDGVYQSTVSDVCTNKRLLAPIHLEAA